MDWLTVSKIPIGPIAKEAVNWLTTNGKGVFDFLKIILQAGIDAVLFVLQGPFPSADG